MKVDYIGNKPQYMTEGAAGADLVADDVYRITPGSHEMINTSTAMKIPEGYFGIAVPRSSLCNKKSLLLVNSVGIIDSDFIGQIKFVYKNTSEYKTVVIEKGERIGQIVLVPFVKADFVEVDELPETKRGSGSFGSTGEK